MRINRRTALVGLALQQTANGQTPPFRASPPAISAFWEPLDRQMVDWLAPPPDAHVLDAGCGRGDHVRLFAERCRVTGVDKNPEVLAYARGRMGNGTPWKRAEWREADLTKLPFDSASFDLVWASHVFHGLPEIERGAGELKRVLKRGGRFVLRENRVLSAVLPADLGYGRHALEARADLAFSTWLAEDRIERGRYPYLWGQILRQAGLRDVRAKSFLHEANPPFSEAQQEYLRYHVGRKAEWQIADEDKRTLREICDPASPHYFLKREDIYFVSVSTIYYGVKA